MSNDMIGAGTLFLSLFTGLFDAVLEKRPTLAFYIYIFAVPALIGIFTFIFARLSIVRKAARKEWFLFVYVCGLMLVATNIPGTLYFHKIGIQYDRFLHFEVSLFAFLLLMLLILPLLSANGRQPQMKFAITAAFLMIFSGIFIWEGLQYVADRLFGSRSFFDAGQPIILDFAEDISFGLAGLFAGVLYAYRFFDRFLSLLNIRNENSNGE